MVWAFVEELDLSAFYARIKARDDVAGGHVRQAGVNRGGV
jgi:hypothetical protein